MTQVWRLVGIGSVNDQSYYTRTGLVLFREWLSFPPVSTVRALSAGRWRCRHERQGSGALLRACSEPGPSHPRSRTPPLAWRGHGHGPHLREARSGLELAQLDPGLAPGVSCKKLTASWGRRQESGPWGTARHPRGRSSEVPHRQGAAGRASLRRRFWELGGPRGWKGSPGRRHGICRAWRKRGERGLAGASGRKTDVAGASYGASEGRGLLTGLGFVF